MLYFFFHAGVFVWDVAWASFHAIVHAHLAGGADRFVVVGRNSERGSQFFVELAQIDELVFVSRDFFLVMREQKLLIPGIPEGRELALQHDARNFGHLEIVAAGLAKFGAAIVLLDADDSARTPDEEPFG